MIERTCIVIRIAYRILATRGLGKTVILINRFSPNACAPTKIGRLDTFYDNNNTERKFVSEGRQEMATLYFTKVNVLGTFRFRVVR